ncbi:MAG: MBL fold metallo-hydrolase [Bacilli bacterium]|nr:MBL fold metallo-hydrolase [Bacilli bacterium]
MLVHILASGSEGNSVYIQTKNKKVLIDTGMNYKYLKERLEEIDVDPSEIDSILITHTHSDHTSALKVFLNKHNPEVYVDEEMLNEIPFLKEYTNLVLDFKDYKFEDTIIEMFHTSHDAPASRGYIIKENDESFVYITDTGYINQRLFKKLYNHTKYVFEANHDVELLMHGRYPQWLKQRILSDKGHLSNAQAGFYLSKIIGPDTKKIALAHLSKENNDPDIALKEVKSILKENDVKFNNFVIAKQRERVEL